VTAQRVEPDTHDVLEEAEIDAVMQQHDEWVAAGRPGAMSHVELMAEVLLER
jgi:hypothetical protein